NIAPWRDELGVLLSDRDEYARRSRSARAAALEFVASADARRFESFLETPEDAARNILRKRHRLVTRREVPFRRGFREETPGLGGARTEAGGRAVTTGMIAVVDPFSSGALLAPAFAERGRECVAVLSSGG